MHALAKTDSTSYNLCVCLTGSIIDISVRHCQWFVCNVCAYTENECSKLCFGPFSLSLSLLNVSFSTFFAQKKKFIGFTNDKRKFYVGFCYILFWLLVRLFAFTTATIYNFHLKLPIKYIFFCWFRTHIRTLRLLAHFRTFFFF